MNQLATDHKHGNLRQIAQDGLRHGACAYRPERDCQTTLDQVCGMQRPFFVREPDAVQVAVYRLAFVNGWTSARELAR